MISSRSCYRIAAALAAGACLCAAAPALAKPDPLAEAKAHFELGRTFFEAGAFDRAIGEYEAAYQAKPLPDFLFNIAQALRMLRQREKAIETYQRFLAHQPEGPAADDARSWIVKLTLELDNEAKTEKERLEQERIAAAKRRPGRLRITSTPPGAQVRIDNEASSRGVTPLEVELPPGEHRVTAQLALHQPASGEATVIPASSSELALTLEAIEEACPPGRLRNRDTLGHCCWPAQVWDGARCVGVPGSCPATFEVSVQAQSCACAEGRVLLAGDPPHCCWPGQAWSIERALCVGVPACARPLVLEDGACVRETSVEREFRSREETVYAERKTRGTRFAMGLELSALRFGSAQLRADVEGKITSGGHGFAGDGGMLMYSLGLRAPLSPRWELVLTADVAIGTQTGNPVQYSYLVDSSSSRTSGDYQVGVGYSKDITIWLGATVAAHIRPLASWSPWVVILGARVLGAVVGPGIGIGRSTCVGGGCTPIGASGAPSLSASTIGDAFLGALFGTSYAFGVRQQYELGVQVALGSGVLDPSFCFTAGPYLLVSF